MTELQEHLMQLLREIDITCEELHIPYALYGNTLRQALDAGEFTGSCYELHLMMSARHAAAIKRALGEMGLAHRAFEDLSTNPKLAVNAIRYVDTSVTLLDREDPVRYDALGAAVTIHPLFANPLAKWDKTLSYGFLFLNGGMRVVMDDLPPRRRTAIRAMRADLESLGGGALARRLYSLIKNDPGPEGAERLHCIDCCGRLRSVPARFLTEAERIPFMGMDVPVPHDARADIGEEPGRWWERELDVAPKLANRVFALCDTTTPYEDTIAYLAEEGLDVRRVQQNEYEHFMWYTDAYQPYLWRKDEYHPWELVTESEYAVARLSRDRIDLYVQLRDKMDDLRRAYRQDDVDALEELLAAYLNRTNAFLRFNRGFFINQELLDMAAKVWQRQGDAAKADRVYAYATDYHKQTDIEALVAPYVNG